MDQRQAENYLRRFLDERFCKYRNGATKVLGRMFSDIKGPVISFHIRPIEWTDQDVDQYRREAPGKDTIPGVLELHESIFIEANTPLPQLESGPEDRGIYSEIHCTWNALDREMADIFANLVSAHLQNSDRARIVFTPISSKNPG